MTTPVFDPWNPAHRADPHAFWNAARDSLGLPSAIGPVTGRRFWFPLRHEDCLAALRHPALGKEPEKHLTPQQMEGTLLGQGPFDILGKNMLFLDPPDHTRLRRLVREPFSLRAIERMRPRVEVIASELVAGLAGRDSFDLIADLALPLPVTVIAELLGIPSADRDRFRAWTQAVLGRGESEEAMLAAGMEFIQYLNDLAELRRSDPGDDLVTYLLTVEDEGERLDHQEFLAMVFLLLVAGHETTVNLIGNGTLELIRHPAQAAFLAADPVGRSGAAVEELIRFHGPVESATMRWAYEDVELGGVAISAGEMVIPMLFPANRDPAVFDQPDRLALDRDTHRHLGFGSGIHLCLGAPLARLEGQIAFTAVARTWPRLELDCDESELVWTPDFFLRGLASLPVRVAAP
jgi:cytochrome P450